MRISAAAFKPKTVSSISASHRSLLSLSPLRLGPASRSGPRIGRSFPRVSSSTSNPAPAPAPVPAPVHAPIPATLFSSESDMTHLSHLSLGLPNILAQVSSYVTCLALLTPESAQLRPSDCHRLHPPPLPRFRSTRFSMPRRTVDRICEFVSYLSTILDEQLHNTLHPS